MDIEKIMKGMRQCAKITARACKECPYDNNRNDAMCGRELLTDAIQLIERLQKEVDESKENEPIEPRFLRGDWVCDKCSAIVCWYTATPTGYIEKNLAKYCPQCGQAVKWE